jgi:hypothetical protein
VETSTKTATTSEQSLFDNDSFKPVIPANLLRLDGGGLLINRLWGRWHYNCTFVNTTGGSVVPTFRFKMDAFTACAFTMTIPNNANPYTISFDHVWGVNDFIGPYLRGSGKATVGAPQATGAPQNAADVIGMTRQWGASAFAVASLHRFDITVQFAGASAASTVGNGSYFEIGRAL